MNWQTHWFKTLGRMLGIILGALGMIGCATSGTTNAPGWKIPPDPEIVNFKRADAEVITQTLVAPPLLPEHEQTADGPPRLIKIRMDIVEREVEIGPDAFV